MSPVTSLAMAAVELYAAAGLALVGFAMMLGGPPMATAAGRFWFVRPAAAASRWLARAGQRLLVSVAVGVWRVLRLAATAFVLYGIDPVARAVLALFDRLLASRRS